MTAAAGGGLPLLGLRVLDEALKLMDSSQGRQPRHDGAECRVCPLCRGIAALREANPEAVSRMGRVLADLAAAFGDGTTGVAEEPDAPVPRPAPPQRVPVQPIDVTD